MPSSLKCAVWRCLQEPGSIALEVVVQFAFMPGVSGEQEGYIVIDVVGTVAFWPHRYRYESGGLHGGAVFSYPVCKWHIGRCLAQLQGIVSPPVGGLAIRVIFSQGEKSA